MEQENILTLERKRVLALVAKEARLANFYLSGGTALAAFYLGHRDSEDLDFFSFESFNWHDVQDFMQKVKADLDAVDMRYEKVFDRNVFFLSLPGQKELKVEFTRYPFKQLGKPTKQLDVMVDSLRDIAANKLMAVIDRFDPKDFVDLFFLLKRYKLGTIRRDARKKFGVTIGDMLLGSELAKVRRVEALPRMLKLLTADELKAFFAKEVRKLGANLLV